MTRFPRLAPALFALLWSLAALAGLSGCDTIHGAGQVSSGGGAAGGAGITQPLPGR